MGTGMGDSHGKCESDLVTKHLLRADENIFPSWLELELPPEIHSPVTHPVISDPPGLRDPVISTVGTFDPLKKSQRLKEVTGSRLLVWCSGKGGKVTAP